MGLKSKYGYLALSGGDLRLAHNMLTECFWLSRLSSIVTQSEIPWQILNSFSLQRLCGCSLITAVFSGCFGAILKASKFHFVQLDSKLVGVELITLLVGKRGFELNRNDLTKGLTLLVSEGQVDSVDLIIHLNMGKESQ